MLVFRGIDDYAKNGGPGKVWLLCSFYHESLRTWIKTIVNKFAISNNTALILGPHALRSYLILICEYKLHSLPNKKVSGAKDHSKNYIKVRPPLVRHLLRNRLFRFQINFETSLQVIEADFWALLCTLRESNVRTAKNQGKMFPKSFNLLIFF